MVIRKVLIKTLLICILLTPGLNKSFCRGPGGGFFKKSPLVAEGKIKEKVLYFLNIPGVRGEVREPGFDGWIQCIAVQYRLPGVPSPTALLKRPPEKPIGMITAEEAGKPYATLSKSLDKIDTILLKAYKDKHRFPQWEFALCTPAGKTYMALIFKDVVISAINQRDDKQYVTFKYEKAVWNYMGIKK